MEVFESHLPSITTFSPQDDLISGVCNLENDIKRLETLLDTTIQSSEMKFQMLFSRINTLREKFMKKDSSKPRKSSSKK
jgi:hypothetical protein